MFNNKNIDKREPVSIIIPTYDNPQQLFQCVESMINYSFEYPLRIIVVNNGGKPCGIEENSIVKVIDAKKNLGWEGGLIEGLKHSTSKYVMFANDDIFIPKASVLWLRNLVRTLDIHAFVGAVGPSSNCVMGVQNVWYRQVFSTAFTSFLIGFCVLLRREALDKAGGVHHTDFGGDDIDLSIRLRKAGYALIVDKDIFVYHHGFQTGEKLYGGPNKPGGWNSKEMTDNTNMGLIRKHGFAQFHNTIINNITQDCVQDLITERLSGNTDVEGLIIQKNIIGDKIVELGCGARKTVENAIGVDYTEKGEICPYSTHKSVADVVADVEEPLPFEKASFDTAIARHILEHCIDVPKTLIQWGEVVRPGGRLIIACPNENLLDGIPLNAQHKHAFTADTIKTLAELIGFKEIARDEMANGVSFVSVLEKVII
jgi:SAM-dependent methyltransferase